jgi:hypothetical protein
MGDAIELALCDNQSVVSASPSAAVRRTMGNGKLQTVLDWKNQGIDLLNQGCFRIVESDSLHVPIEKFVIRRDENFALMIETEAALTATSTAAQHPSGTVILNTEQVELVNISGFKAVLSGVQTHTVKTTQRTLNETAQIHQLSVTLGDPKRTAYTIEWLENLPVSPYIWPDSIRIETETTTVWNIALSKDGIALSGADRRVSVDRTAVKLSVAGNTFYVCALGNLDSISGIKPGCIIYVGMPDDIVRKKIRTALSFALGVYLIELGHTLYDQEWRIILAAARSAYTLGRRAFDLIPKPLAPLTDRNWQYDLGGAKLTRMVNALFSTYEALDLGNLSWAYWHAYTATPHIAPVHFGAAIEALRRVYDINNPGKMAKSVVDKTKWKLMNNAICGVIDDAEIPEEDKKIMKNNIHQINRVPQRKLLKETFLAIDIDLGESEYSAWNRRNAAAHGTPIPEGQELDAINDMKLLAGLFHRMLLRISNASDDYIDYASSLHPPRPLKEPPPLAVARSN